MSVFLCKIILCAYACILCASVHVSLVYVFVFGIFEYLFVYLFVGLFVLVLIYLHMYILYVLITHV